MKSLVNILEREGICRTYHATEDRQKIVARGIQQYLKHYPAVSIEEVRKALLNLQKEHAVDFGESWIDTCSKPCENEYLRTSLKYASLKEAIECATQDERADFGIKVTFDTANRRASGAFNYLVFYSDEKRFYDFIRKRLTKPEKVMHYQFRVPSEMVKVYHGLIQQKNKTF